MKVLELMPTPTNPYPSTAIIFVGGIIGIMASGLHTRPKLIEWVFAKAMSPVKTLKPFTPAGGGVPANQRVLDNLDTVGTLALAKPPVAFGSTPRKRLDCKSTKGLVNKRHGTDITKFHRVVNLRIM